MAAKNLMGFKKVDELPPIKHRGVYDDLLELVAKTADIYALDVADNKRAINLVTTLKARASMIGVPVKVIKRGTVVCLVRRADVPLEPEANDD